MTDVGPPSTLSSTYWELHRNTLLFSALLLIICIPGAHPDTKQSFLWLSFTDVAFNSVRLIVLCVATYAFLTYLLEWRSEPYALLRKEAELAENSRIKADQLIEAATSKLLPVLGNFRRMIENAHEDLHPYISNDETHTADEIGAIVNTTFEELSQMPHHLGNPMHGFLRAISRHEQNGQTLEIPYVLKNGGEAIKETALIVANASCAKISRESTARLKMILEGATGAATGLQASLDDLRTSKKGLFYIDVNARRALRLYKARSSARVMLVGLAVPLLVYAVAIAHLAGQLGVAHLPSVFDLIQKPMTTNGKKPLSQPTCLDPASTKA